MNSSRKTRRTVVPALVAISLFAAACGGNGDGDDDAPTQQEGGFAGTIDIGWLADTAGAYETYGSPTLNGALLSVKLINEAGGVQVGDKAYELNLEVCDSNSEEDQAVACAQSFVRDEGIKYVLGGIGTLGLAVPPVTDPAKAIYMTAGSTALEPHLEEFPYAFVTIAGNPLKASLAAQGVREALPDVQTVAFLMVNDATIAILPLLQEEFTKAGYEVVAAEKFDPEALDVTPFLNKIKLEEPDLLFTGFGLTQAAPVVQANRELHASKYTFIAGGGCDTLVKEIGDQIVIGTNFSSVDLAQPPNAKAAEFVAAYTDFVNNDPSAHGSPSNLDNINGAVLTIDAIPVLAAAIEKAGTFEDTDAVRDALLSTEIDGVTGPYGFLPARTAKTGLAFCTRNLDGDGVMGSLTVNPPE